MKKVFKVVFLQVLLYFIVLSNTTFSVETSKVQQINEAQLKQDKVNQSFQSPDLKVQGFKTKHGYEGWQVEIPGAHPLATAAIDESMIYIGGGFGSYDFYAIDLKTGKLKWYYRSKDDGPTAAVVYKRRVIFNTESCTLEVLDKTTGKPVWSKWLGDPLLSQPAAWEDMVYMVYPDANKNTHMIIALKLENGEEIWKQPVSGDIISAPVISDGIVYLTTLDGNNYAFNAYSGKLLWQKQEKATSAPWINNKKMFVARKKETGNKTQEGITVNESSSGKKLLKEELFAVNQEAKYFDPKRQNTAKEKQLDASVGFSSVPSYAKLKNAEMVQGINTVSGAWSYQGSRPIVVNDKSYVSMDTLFEKTDAKTGKTIWKKEIKPKNNYGGRYLTPPIIANGKIFVGTMGGEIMCVNDNDGKVVWEYSVGSSIQSQLSLDNGYLVATTTNGRIIAINLKDKKLGGWNMWGGNAQHNK